MNRTGRFRSLKEAIDLRDLSVITAEQLVRGGLNFCQAVRRRATQARHSDNPIVCARCGWPVYLTKNGLTKEYLWAHFANVAPVCDWFTGKSLTPAQVGARQFGGLQESPLHMRIKNLIGDLLRLDYRADADLQIDTRLEGVTGFRKPDVRVTYSGRKTAFEIQLSSTQLPTILGREKFYIEEKWSLVWITWKPQIGAKSDIAQAFLDIITAHNDNLFSIDDETIRLSRESRTLVLRVHWWQSDKPLSKLVTLDELRYPDDRLPFAIDQPPSWHDKFKDRWVRITSAKGSDWRERKYLYAELICHLDLQVSDTDLNSDYEVEALINLLISLERGSIVGSRQKSLTEMLHTFLTTRSRQPLASIAKHAIKISGNADLLSRPKTAEMLNNAKAVQQAGKGSVEARITRALFPTWAVRVQ